MIAWSSYKPAINIVNWLALQKEHVTFDENRRISFFYKKLLHHQKTPMFRNYFVDFECFVCSISWSHIVVCLICNTESVVTFVILDIYIIHICYKSICFITIYYLYITYILIIGRDMPETCRQKIIYTWFPKWCIILHAQTMAVNK